MLVLGTEVDLAVCEPDLVQIWSDTFLERDAATKVEGLSCGACTYPLGKAVGVGLPKLATRHPPWVYTLAVPGMRRCRRGAMPCRADKCKETKHTFIYFNNLVLKPEVDTHPRESLNDLPAAKFFFFFVAFPNPHLLQSGKQSPQI